MGELNGRYCCGKVVVITGQNEVRINLSKKEWTDYE
jgi:hypothetical protein